MFKTDIAPNMDFSEEKYLRIKPLIRGLLTKGNKDLEVVFVSAFLIIHKK